MFKMKNVSMIYDMNSDDKMYALNGLGEPKKIPEWIAKQQ